jgi:hypothetical protein
VARLNRIRRAIALPLVRQSFPPSSAGKLP